MRATSTWERITGFLLANKVIVVIPVALLFPPFGSGSVAVTVPVFSSRLPSAMVGTVVTVIVATAEAPSASVPRGQLSVVVPAQDPPTLSSEAMSVTVADRRWEIVTLVASDGPRLVAVKT